jgi:hypothetical protein
MGSYQRCHHQSAFEVKIKQSAFLLFFSRQWSISFREDKEKSEEMKN